MPTISVIVPVYNVEKYLPECLASIVKQTCTDLEIICVNDGSTDNSPGILNRFVKYDNRIKVINKKNTGYGHSMNVGLRAATGEYVVIVESDDFAGPDMCESLYNVARRNGADVVSARFFLHTGGEDRISGLEKRRVYNTVFTPRSNKDIWTDSMQVWSCAFRKDFLTKNDIWFNETPGASYQDTAFVIKAAACAERMMFIQDAFLHYRTDNASSSVHSKDKVFCICDEFEEIWNFISNRQELHEFFQYKVAVEQYMRYMWNYNRLADERKGEFLDRMIKDFQELAGQDLIVKEYWFDTEAWNQVQDMISRPEKVRYEHFAKRQECRLYSAALEQELNSRRKVYVYGAGQVGRKTIAYLKRKGIVPTGVMVSSMEGNPESLLGVEVREVDTVSPTSECAVLIAIREQDQYEVLPRLEALGWEHIIALDAQAREALQI